MGGSDAHRLEDDLRRLVQQQALPGVGAERRAQLQMLATALHGIPAGEKTEHMNLLVARVIEREMQAGSDRLQALAIAVAEAVVLSRELEWLTFMEMPPEGTA
jgi:hypothetical protein